VSHWAACASYVMIGSPLSVWWFTVKYYIFHWVATDSYVCCVYLTGHYIYSTGADNHWRIVYFNIRIVLHLHYVVHMTYPKTITWSHSLTWQMRILQNDSISINVQMNSTRLVVLLDRHICSLDRLAIIPWSMKNYMESISLSMIIIVHIYLELCSAKGGHH